MADDAVLTASSESKGASLGLHQSSQYRSLLEGGWNVQLDLFEKLCQFRLMFEEGEKERRTTPLTREVEVVSRYSRSLRSDESILGRVPVSIVILDGIPDGSIVSRVMDQSSESSVVLLSVSNCSDVKEGIEGNERTRRWDNWRENLSRRS